MHGRASTGARGPRGARSPRAAARSRRQPCSGRHRPCPSRGREGGGRVRVSAWPEGDMRSARCRAPGGDSHNTSAASGSITRACHNRPPEVEECGCKKEFVRGERNTRRAPVSADDPTERRDSRHHHHLRPTRRARRQDHHPAQNLACAFAESGHRVLCVDLDPQGNLTMSQGIDPEDCRSRSSRARRRPRHQGGDLQARDRHRGRLDRSRWGRDRPLLEDRPGARPRRRSPRSATSTTSSASTLRRASAC